MAMTDILESWHDVIHPAALILPRLDAVQFAELKADIRRNGLLVAPALFVEQDGVERLVDGVSRLCAMIELGHSLRVDGQWQINMDRYYAKDGADPFLLVVSLNVRRRHLTLRQRREAAEKLIMARPELSNRAVAQAADLDPHTVSGVRQRAGVVFDGPRVEITGRMARGRHHLRTLSPDVPRRKRERRMPSVLPLLVQKPRRHCPHCGAPIDRDGRYDDGGMKGE